MGDELSRDNIMRQAPTIKDFVAPGSLPGASINTSFTNYFPLRLLQLARFNGENAHILVRCAYPAHYSAS
jgi:branched-chain amino acid transport system substrate-binding protein